MINLAPSGVKKSGSHFDLAMAVSLLHEAGQMLAIKEDLREIAFIGELSLNAELRPVSGVLPMAIAARESGLKKLIVPIENYGEAILVTGIEVYAFRTLIEVVNYLQGLLEYQSPVLSMTDRTPSEKDGLDFFDVRGQEVLIEYIVAAVAGGHNIIKLGYITQGTKPSKIKGCSYERKEILRSRELK